jgi:hypothetical protein
MDNTKLKSEIRSMCSEMSPLHRNQRVHCSWESKKTTRAVRFTRTVRNRVGEVLCDRWVDSGGACCLDSTIP